MKPAACKFALLFILALAGGCAEPPCPPITLDTARAVPAVDYSPLAVVLNACVLSNGLADRVVLPNYADPLNRQLVILAVTGPTATPALFDTRADRLAYWYNAHAAWSMKLLVARGCPRLVGAGAMLDRQFPLDGRTMTLREIGQILAAEDDFRIAATVPGVTTCDARLPDKPISPEGFDRTVADRFQDLLADNIRVHIDVRHRRMLIPPALWQFRQRLVDDYNRTYHTQGATLITALLGMTTGQAHRHIRDALGYEEVEAVCRQLLTEERTNDGNQ